MRRQKIRTTGELGEAVYGNSVLTLQLSCESKIIQIEEVWLQKIKEKKRERERIASHPSDWLKKKKKVKPDNDEHS